MPGCGIEDRNVLKGILILILCLVFSCPFGLYAEICMSGDSASEIGTSLDVDFMGFELCSGDGVIFEDKGVSIEVACQRNPKNNFKKGWTYIPSPDGGFHARCVNKSNEPSSFYFRCRDIIRRFSNEGTSSSARCSNEDAMYLNETSSRLLSEGNVSSAEALSRRGIAADSKYLPNYLVLGRSLLARGTGEDEVVSELIKLGSKAPYSADMEAMLSKLSRMELR